MTLDDRRNRFLAGDRDIPFAIFLGSLVLILAGLGDFLWSGQGRETWLVVSGTLPFFILTAFLLIGGIGFWLKSDKFSGMELTLFAGITLPCSYITLAYAFLWFTAMGQEVSPPLPGKVFDSYPLMLQATLAGHGIALGWRRTTERLIDAGELIRPVEEALIQPEAIAVYTHREAMDRYACRVLLDWLAETLNDTPS